MKITKSKLKQLIKEELSSVLKEDDSWEEYHRGVDAAVAGQDVPNETKYPELLEAVKEVMDLSFGEGNYNLYKELQALAEFQATGGSQGEHPAVEFDPGSDEPPFRGPDPRKTAELRQQTRAQGGYSGKDAWKPRE